MPGSDDQSGKLRAFTPPLLTLTTITMILRCYVRGLTLRAFGIDDAISILSMIFYLALSGIIISGSRGGIGRKPQTLTDHEIVDSYKLLFFGEMMYGLSIAICKISVCFFLMRIAVKPLHIRLVYSMLVFLIIQSIVFLILNWVKCKPISYFWDRMSRDLTIEGRCMSAQASQATAYAPAAILVITDVIVGIVLPIIIIRKLQMPRASKFAVAGVLGLACVSAAATIIRLPYVVLYDNGDYIYNSVLVSILAYLELSLAITAANLATLGPLLRTWFGVLSSREHTPTTPIIRSLRGRPRGVRDQSYPLSTFDETAAGASRLRPDKLSITVTQVTTQRHSDAGDANTSREQLTFEPEQGEPTGSSSEFGLGIYRTTEVSQTSDVESMVIKEHRS
ncbi:uncharacterized protein BDV14DRAFT_175933 [Aspergillus stella-maris]|uniref:uncharacterized protein n=1 Tax=Aspergillus stella-maris TaxID=1810926 RepID=UPI003CCD3B2D